MIRAIRNPPFVITTPEISEEERAANIAGNAQFQLNLAWWNAHVAEIRAAHTGKFVCVAGQELFVGDDPIEVVARAKAAHPNPGRGFLSLYLSHKRGPKISSAWFRPTPADYVVNVFSPGGAIDGSQG